MRLQSCVLVRAIERSQLSTRGGRLKITLLLVVFFLIQPFALLDVFAQQDCQPILRLVQSAGAKFADIRGRRTGDGIYETTLTLPSVADRDDCYVFSSPAVYQCSWSRFRSDAERIDQGHRLGRLVQHCLSREPRVGSTEGSARYTFRLIDTPRVGEQIVIEVKANRGGVSLDFEIRHRD